MARATLLTVLLVGLCLAGQALGSSNQRRRSQSSLELEGQFSGAGQQQPQPFRPNHQYTFTYKGQISTGLQQQDGATGGGDPAQQKSSTRIQAQAVLHFHSERHATLQLQQIRLGHLNQRISNAQQVQPMDMFEPKQIDAEKRRELEQPCAFTYEEGVVSRINFHPQDSTWSKNIKRAVLNMLQLNLKRNNAQGVRVEGQAGGQDLSAEQQQGNQFNDNQLTKVFTLPEITIEGECQTTYTINKASRQGAQQQSEENTSSNEEQGNGDWAPQSLSCPTCFNVTKSINFKQCSKISDVAYGFQTQQQQPGCVQCQAIWAKQQQQNQQAGSQSSQQQQNQQAGPCEECDPKEVKDDAMDRSTIQRFVLTGKPNGKYAIKRSELISNYVYKTLRAEGAQDASTMQAVVAAELVFRGAKQQNAQSDNQMVKQLQQMKPSTERDETILFSNDWDVEEKRFYMYGDSEFVRTNPFVHVTNKVEQVQNMIRKLVQVASNKQAGIEVDEVVQIQRLAELLRMCSGEELKKIQANLLSEQQQQQGGGRNEADQQKVQHILGDALAIAGTHNTINALVDQILQQKPSPTKAAQCLKNLQGLPAPSDSQVTTVLRLCKSELVNRHPALKQSCWLSLGAMIGELCSQKTQKNAQQTPFGAQSGFNKEEICPTHKKEIYKQTLIERYQEAQTTYQKVLALKCLGNAGIDIAVPELEQIIKNKREQRVPRIQAIDGLRRLRTQIPRKIQRILLPIFLNTREQPEVRMAAFAMIMQTQPEQPVVDQLAYCLTKERSKQVLSFAYSTMQTLSESSVPCQQSLAKHLKSALKLVNIDESTFQGRSKKQQVPIYSSEEKEGLFVTLTSVVSSRSALPSHLAISLDTLINGQFEINNVKVGMTQQNVEQWSEKVLQQLLQQAQQYAQQQQQPTRGQRSSQQQSGGTDQLRKIFKVLGIKSRQQQGGFTSIEQQTGNGNGGDRQEQPFGMINVRVGDVDQCVLSIDQQSLPSFARQMLRGQKPSLRELMQTLEQQQNHFRLFTAHNLNEKSAKIATSMGISLRIVNSFPILASVEGQAKLAQGGEDRLESSSSGSQKLQLSLHPSIAVAHIQTMETWCPMIITGVESVRCMEINLPIQAEAQASRQKGVELSIKLPQSQGQKIRIFGVHTLPVTYHREVDSKTKMSKIARVKKIHNEELEQSQREVMKTVGEHTLGLPLRIVGHYHTPSSPLTYKDIIQLLMGTENQIHITYEPTSDSPRAIRLVASGGAFQPVSAESFDSHRPQLNDFYKNKFEQAYPEEYQEMQLEDHNQRREKLSAALSNYQPEVMYKHHMKLSAENVGGAKRVKAQIEVEAACDGKLKYCKAFTKVERTPMGPNEQQPWQLKAKLQILSPDVVSSVHQLSQVEKKHQKFVCQAETEWGQVDSKKQYLNVRIQGEKASKPQWQQIHSMRQQREGGNANDQKSYQKKTAFLNKFDIACDYKLQPRMQNMFSSAFEAVKAQYFWSTESQQLNDQQNEQRSSADGQSQGQVYCTVVIDPISQKHCNISVKTPTQAVRIQNARLPTQLRPFPLIRPQSEKSTHSVGQVFERLGVSNQGRAQCTVDGKRVNTFDNAVYTAPLSKCYTVLAKDCSSDEPQFSVLMKNLGQQGQQQSGSQQAKKLKVITPDQVIECQPKNPSSQQPIEQQPLTCKVNGREIGQRQQRQQQQGSGSFEMQQTEANVQYDNEEKTSCTINVPGVQVRFNGAKASIKISNAYKNGQCGLCGHYNDQADDDWMMPNNERAFSLDSFHRSYALQEDQECSAQEQDDFYKQNKNKFAIESSEEFRGQKQLWGANNNDQQQQRRGQQGYQNAYSDEYSDDTQDDDDEEEQSWWGQKNQHRRSQQWKRGGNKFGGSGSNSQEQQQTEEPVKQTKVIEYSGMICFSTTPVKQCPEGSWPANNNQNNENDYSGEQQQQGRQSSSQSQQGSKKVQFACLPRSSLEARRLQRQARQGVVVDVSNLQPSFAETVKQPKNGCVRY